MKRHLARGFTLIELMIVVAIIGILASIALPNFIKFQGRARQSESKANLKAAFESIKGTSGSSGSEDYSCFNTTSFCGFKPEKGNIYTYHAKNSDGTAVKLDVDANKKDAAGDYAVSSNAEAVLNDNKGNFVIQAVGQVDSDTFMDAWFINQDNMMCNGKLSSGKCETTLSGNDVEKSS